MARSTSTPHATTAAAGKAGRLAAAALLSCLAGAVPVAHAAPTVAPQVLRVEADNGFDLGDKARRAASGVACTRRADGSHLCLVAFDEGTEARHARLQGGAWLPQPQRVRLLAPQGGPAGRGGDGPGGGHKDKDKEQGRGRRQGQARARRRRRRHRRHLLLRRRLACGQARRLRGQSAQRPGGAVFRRRRHRRGRARA